MRALSYLLLHRLKNSIKSLIRRPATLILTVVMIALFVMVLVTGRMSRLESEAFRSANELYSILFLLYGFIFMTGALSGLSNGASFFTMADVNMLFNAPLAPRLILNYGLLRQLGTTLMMGFFLLFQYTWLAGVYGIRPFDLVGILVGYALAVFCGQLTAMGIYSFSSGSDSRKRIIRVILYACCIAIVAWAVLPVLGSANLLGALTERVGSRMFSYIPFAGWLRELAAGFIAGAPVRSLLGLAPTIVFIVGFALLVMRQNADFYEDVLTATEVSYSAITARKEGKAAESMPRNIKKGREGFDRGRGASVFFHKHLRENRRSRIFLLDTVGLVFCLMSIGFAFFTRDSGVVPAMAFTCYMMVFSSFTGRWNREMLLPYVYLVPEGPFVKLVAICGENILKCLVEGIVVFVPIGFILSLSVPEVLACIALRLGLGLLLIAATMLSERLFGAIVVKAVQMMLYFLVIIVLLIPAIVLAVVASTDWGWGLTPILLAITAWLTLCSALLGLLCRDILNFAELNNQ